MGTMDPGSLGVYVVTSAGFVAGRGHRDVALAAIAGGATAVQLRAPELSDHELLPIALELAARSREADVLFVVNDRLEVAAASSAAGVHLGQGDDLDGARGRLGPGRVLGVSVDAPEQARMAEANGADYVGVTVWSSVTKPEAVPVGLDGLGAVVEATSLPVVAIGGIDASNAPLVLAAGAAGVAVVSAVGAAPDPRSATRGIASVVRGALRTSDRRTDR
jgi:thiamine-phosphate pyrophosphorylase